MNISGSQKVKAPRMQVFTALLNPHVLQESIPGCESAELVDMADGQQLKLKIALDQFFKNFEKQVSVIRA